MSKQPKKQCENNRCEHCSRCEESVEAPQEVKEVQKQFFYLEVPEGTDTQTIQEFKEQWNNSGQFSIEPLTEDNEEPDIGLTLDDVEERMAFYEGYQYAIKVLKDDCDRDRHAEAIVLLETELSYWDK